MLGKNTYRKAAILAVALIGASAARADLLTNYGSWGVDRHAPGGFANVGAANGRSDVLQVDIAGADQQVGTFLNQQGKGSDITPVATDYAVIYGSLYVPSSWQNGTGATDLRSTALWGFAINSIDDPALGNSHYPIIGFTNGGGDASGDTTAGTGRFRVFDSSDGWMPASYQPVQYNAWNNLCMVLTGGTIKSYVNGTLAYTQTDLGLPNGPADRFNRLVVNTYNYGDDYSAQWSNLGAGKLASVAASSGNGQSTAAGSAFAAPLTVEARDASGAPLPCVPVTFTAPGSGASTTQTTTTVMTDYAGRASLTATANGATGSYAVTASAPGIQQPATLSLTNTAAAVTAVPTLGEWALIAMSVLLGVLGLGRARRSAH